MFNIEISPELSQHFSETNKGFSQVMALQGEIYRQVERRRTLRFFKDNRGYFAKLHFGVGWAEIMKNLLQGRLPIVSAKSEYQAIKRLQQLNVTTMTIAGFGEKGFSPATRKSFLITKEIVAASSLEDYCRPWKKSRPTFAHKKMIIEKLAATVKTMHHGGLNHRDCYLCHFYLYSDPFDIGVIDLHRSQLRKKTPQRWLVKDVSGLYFSAMDVGLTQRDFFRFIKIYSGKPLRECFSKENGFWRKVVSRAEQLYQKENRK